MPAHYLDFSDLTAAQTRAVLARAAESKAARRAGKRPPALAGRVLMLFFERPSTRTRASFSAAMAEAGGNSFALDAAGSQMSRGESAADTARAVSTMCDAAVIRGRRELLLEFAAHSACPVINGLTERSHPCQALADVFTFTELRGGLRGKKIAWLGDFNNVLFSWSEAAEMFGAELHAACPPEYRPENPPKGIVFTETAAQAAEDAAAVMTDVWASMGDEKEAKERRRKFAAYSASAAVMKMAAKDAVFMHCLPAHRGEEVAAEVIDGPQSAVWRQAENRMHVQKALLEFLILGEEAE